MPAYTVSNGPSSKTCPIEGRNARSSQAFRRATIIDYNSPNEAPWFVQNDTRLDTLLPDVRLVLLNAMPLCTILCRLRSKSVKWATSTSPRESKRLFLASPWVRKLSALGCILWSSRPWHVLNCIRCRSPVERGLSFLIAMRLP